MKEQVWWYATRAAGLMTWSTAIASVIVGLLLSLRAIRSRTGPWALDLHRFLGGLTVVFLVTHLVTLWADSYVEFGWRELLVPGESAYETQAVAWGVVAAWIIVAVEITSILRKHLGTRVWRVVHWTSLLAVAGGTVHGLEVGSDAEHPVVWAVAGGGSIAIIVLGAVRLRSIEVKAAAGRPRTDSEILVEMRQRLADLPVQEAESRVELVTEATTPLPRREAPAHQGLGAGVGIDEDPMGNGTLLEALGRAVRSEQPAGSRGFAPDPFESVPQPDELDTVGAWPGPSPDDPFAPAGEHDGLATSGEPPQPPPVDATRGFADTGVVTDHDELETRSPRPFLDQPIEPEPADPTGRMPDLTTSPFARTSDTGVAPPPAPPATPPARLGDAPLSTPVEDAFAAPTAPYQPPTATPPPPEPYQPPTASPPPEPYQPPTATPPPPPEPHQPPAAAPPAAAPQLPTRPLRPVIPFSEPSPPPMSITAPAPPPPPAGPPTAPLAPPELPVQAIDPDTGEPDEAAYREWLVEWLAFAEQYGDEAPSDPSRA